jgi:hypothetical protein
MRHAAETRRWRLESGGDVSYPVTLPPKPNRKNAASTRANASLVVAIIGLVLPPSIALLTWFWASDYSKNVHDSWGFEFAAAGIMMLAAAGLGIALALTAFILGSEGMHWPKNTLERLYSATARILAIVVLFGCLGFVGYFFRPDAGDFKYPEATLDLLYVQQVTSQKVPAMQQAVRDTYNLVTNMRAEARTLLLSKTASGVEAFYSRYDYYYYPKLLAARSILSRYLGLINAGSASQEYVQNHPFVRSLKAVDDAIADSQVLNHAYSDPAEEYRDYYIYVEDRLLHSCQLLHGADSKLAEMIRYGGAVSPVMPGYATP